MKVVSVINYKGGVGKTTVTSNLAAQLAWEGHRVLAIDLDPQTNLTFSFLRPAEWESHFAEARTIKVLFDSLIKGQGATLSGMIHEPERAKAALKGNGKLEIICSHLGLINVDLELATLLAGANMRPSTQNVRRVQPRLAARLNDSGQDT